ncbi:hypothetical protein SCLCIDRAFT_1223741 [Scleroderma citrinum Foug A]|uniref:Secreted protein n=1 Tax=Scleroderma citrinum Foug A TaxID=1036808 RepID=A0A0C2YRW6_9AGAM|nr:hypothetical protein SCLCIDRAFT_1223741 [Scleroderma citrinum Foug A]
MQCHRKICGWATVFMAVLCFPQPECGPKLRSNRHESENEVSYPSNDEGITWGNLQHLSELLAVTTASRLNPSSLG